MPEYLLLPPTPQSQGRPVVRFLIAEEGFRDAWAYDVAAGPEGLDWRPGHRPARYHITRDEEARAWEEARSREVWPGDDEPF